MKRIFSALLLTMIAGLAASAAGPVFVMPLEDEIDARAWQHTRRACQEARDMDASLFVVRMNTYGGALDAADSIRSALMRLPIPTVAYINHNAASAGALIALACDSVFMAPGSSMGAATVVDGSGNPMPDKYQSYMSSIMRSTAEHHGKQLRGDTLVWRRDPAMAAAMVRGDSILSFTPTEAAEAGFSDGTVNSFDEMLSRLGASGDELHTYSPNLTDDILGFLSNAAVRAMLVMLIIGGIYMEMHTPGLGFAAAVALVASCLYFLPLIVTDALPAWILITLIVGIVLIALELFVIPGFGICGAAGIVAVIVALCAAIVPSAPAGEEFTLSLLGKPVAIICTGLVAAVAAVAWLTSKHGPRFIRRHSELMLAQNVKDGYIGVDMQPASLVGQKARALTVLRPAGKIMLGNDVYDAVSTGEFIDAGAHVRIMRYENAQLYVEPINLTV